MILSKDPQFQKVRLGARGFGGSATYWLGPDHLLIVTQDGYTERYRRIYYRDIQALVIRRTATWIWITVMLIGALIVLGVLPLSIGDAIGLWMGGINIGIWGTFLAIHLIAGPTCGLRLITAVQNRDLPHINRWKQAERLVNALQAEVNRVQQRVVVQPAPGAANETETETGPATPAPSETSPS
jgi:hypothetical protein